MYLALERNYDFIHCAGVEIEEQPVLFIAPSMGGKSTLADYFLKRGHALLTDDKAGTFFHDGKFYVTPSHPHHRPYRQSEVLGDRVERFASKTGPILALYLLEQGTPASALDISEVIGYQKFQEIMPNYLHGFPFMKARRMRWLASLVDQVHVYRVRRPWDLACQREVYDSVCAHVATLQSEIA
jgi:hypothetical protein